MTLSRGLQLSCKHSIKRIGPYETKFSWKYSEAPRDVRALDALKIFDRDMWKKVSGWHRKHGGLEGLCVALSRFDKVYTNFNKFSPENQSLLRKAEEVTRTFLCTSRLSNVYTPNRYRPSSNANSGLPHLAGRKDILPLIHDEAHKLYRHISATPTKPFKSYKVPPVIPALKSMPSPSDSMSTRGIWNYPAAITALESMFGSDLYTVLLQARDTQGVPLMHGVGAFNKAKGFLKSIDVGEAAFIKDWIKGDTQIPGWLIKMAKGLLEEKVDFTRLNGSPIPEHQQQELKRVWDYVWWYFQNTPIVFCNVLYRKSGGIPSGSLFTLLCWCVISLLISVFLCLKVEKRVPSIRDVIACGDDNGQRVKVPGLKLETYLKAAREIGVYFHGKGKSSLTYWPNADREYLLSTKFQDPSKIYRNEVDMFCRMCYPQSWVPDREHSVGRVLMVSMSVLNTMPKVYNFAKWYATFKPAWLGKPISVDTDILKYFRFVHGGQAPVKLVRSQRLGDLYIPFRNTVKLTMCVATT